MTARLDITPKTTKQNRVVRTSKSDDEVINQKKLRSRYCTSEAMKLTTDRHEASCGLFATAELLVSPYGSAIILVLSASNIFTKFRQRHPLRGAKYRWSINISRFSTNKSLYPVNDTDSAIVTGRRIGAHMRSIKWCHFQWPWTNPDLFSRSLPVDLIN